MNTLHFAILAVLTSGDRPWGKTVAQGTDYPGDRGSGLSLSIGAIAEQGRDKLNGQDWTPWPARHSYHPLPVAFGQTDAMSLGDRWNQMTGKKRFVVTRVFIHLKGEEATPLLGVLNQAGREAVAAEGDLAVLGRGLESICQALLNYRDYWRSAANEGEVFWQEEEAGDFVNELFTDSASRYLSDLPLEQWSQPPVDEVLTLLPTGNLVVMLTVAYEGEDETLENDLAAIDALEDGLKSLITLHHNERLRAIQVHFSPAKLGDELSDDQLLSNFPELVPL